jgi:U3 small nucleolar RNA-associated protein 4
MTAKHQMYEFDVLAGRLSDWSRHHPTAVLPEDFLNVKDRAMDAVWDVTERRQRIWLYGPSWLFMLNVGGGDLGSGPTPRKRRPSTGVAADVTMAKKLKTSGAGSRTVVAERDGLPARLIRTENGTVVDVDLDARHATKSGDEGDDGGDEDVDLRLTRVTDADGGGPGALTAAAPSRKWWCTFQYRPILGVVALADDANVEEDKPLEVVVVERPVWDILEEGASVKS